MKAKSDSTGSRERLVHSIVATSDLSLCEDCDETSMSSEVLSSISEFKNEFKSTSLRGDGLVMLAPTSHDDESTLLFASKVKNHLCMHPALVSSVFHPGSFEQIIQEMRIERGEYAPQDDSAWDKIKTELGVDLELRCFKAPMNAMCLSFWFVGVLRIFDRLSRHRQLSYTQSIFGLKGALAFPTEEESVGINPNAGYLSKADLVFCRDSKPFAVVAFEWENEIDEIAVVDRPWYEIDAVLARIFCDMSGAETCKFGLLLTQNGFKLLYRIKAKDIPSDETPVYKYYAYPSDESLADCLDDKVKFEELLRIMYEIALTILGETADSPLKKMRRSGISDSSSQTPQTNAGVDDSLVSQLADVTISDFKSDKFNVDLADGSLIPFKGLFDFSPDFLEENCKSSESEYSSAGSGFESDIE